MAPPPPTTSAMMTTFIMTPRYSAPELMMCPWQGDTRYGSEVDVWSFGTIFFEVLTGGEVFLEGCASDSAMLCGIICRLGAVPPESWLCAVGANELSSRPGMIWKAAKANIPADLEAPPKKEHASGKFPTIRLSEYYDSGSCTSSPWVVVARALQWRGEDRPTAAQLRQQWATTQKAQEEKKELEVAPTIAARDVEEERPPPQGGSPPPAASAPCTSAGPGQATTAADFRSSEWLDPATVLGSLGVPPLRSASGPVPKTTPTSTTTASGGRKRKKRTAFAGCQCSGHCYVSGHRYNNGCDSLTTAPGSDFCFECKCEVHDCVAPRLRGPLCYRHKVRSTKRFT